MIRKRFILKNCRDFSILRIYVLEDNHFQFIIDYMDRKVNIYFKDSNWEAETKDNYSPIYDDVIDEIIEILSNNKNILPTVPSYRFNEKFTNETKDSLIRLNLFYSKFNSLYLQFNRKEFWDYNEKERFKILKEILGIFGELKNFKPIKQYKNEHRFGSSVIELFVVLRHLLVHFPYFDRWNEVWFTKEIVQSNSGTIHKFFTNNFGTYSFRINNEVNGKIKLPHDYQNNQLIFLNEILEETKGVLFIINYIKIILDEQLEFSGETLKL